MPELPEVESFRRYMERTTLGRRIVGVDIDGERTVLSTIEGIVQGLRGRRFVAARRHGKWAFIEMDDGRFLALHFGMTGYPVHGNDPAPGYTRVAISFDDGSSLYISDQRRFGRIGVVDSMDELIGAKGLGPDALTIDREEFVNRMNRRKMAKTALMDQSILAGVGNLYADETLFQTGIHPQKRLDQLEEGRVEDLFASMVSILEKGVETGADLKALPDDLLIHRREEGAECPRCGGRIGRIEVGGRGTYYCPDCQRS
jgi:formamidopyrimidine-DNA glycosylase